MDVRTAEAARYDVAEIDARIDKLLANDTLTDEQIQEHAWLVRVRETYTRGNGRKTDPDRPRVVHNEPEQIRTPGKSAWINLRDGSEVVVLGAKERFSDRHDGADRLSIGRKVRGLVIGKWRGAEFEKSAISETGAGGGTFLVPDPLSAQIIDLARANSVLIAAGVPSVDMTSETLRIAKLATDPTMEVKAENTAFAGSDITFGSALLTARTLGTVISMSRELAEDAVNAGAEVERVLGVALGLAVDKLALTGNGGGDGVLGITNTPDIGSTAAVGAIAWENVHNAVVDVRDSNFNPNGYVLSPTIAGDLDIITSGDGTNSAKMWLGPPPSLNGVTRFQKALPKCDQF